MLLFGIPGAFTSLSARAITCPAMSRRRPNSRRGAIDGLACISINDCFVMKAFGEAAGADGKIEMLADSMGDFTKGIGLDADASSFGLGLRSERYAMIVNDGKVGEPRRRGKVRRPQGLQRRRVC